MAQGDQIYVYRELFKLEGLYEHHGIDCGDGSVIHYRKPSEIIEQTSIETFSRGHLVYQQEYSAKFFFLPEIVIQRAESRLGENKYNLLFNNCEHFATWCKTGISESKQIKEFIPFITQLDTVNLYEPIKQALYGSEPQNAKQLLNGALTDIKEVWDELQPQYQESLKEMEIWEQVAKKALQNKREDLAREALHRKIDYKKRAADLEEQLKQLATMTDSVLKNLLTANQYNL
jgi:hypothetical protein